MADVNTGGGGGGGDEGVYRIVKPVVIAGLETSYLCQLEQGGKTVKVRIQDFTPLLPRGRDDDDGVSLPHTRATIVLLGATNARLACNEGNRVRACVTDPVLIAIRSERNPKCGNWRQTSSPRTSSSTTRVADSLLPISMHPR